MAETERPWSSIDASPAPSTLPEGQNSAGADGAPTVTVRYAAVDGADGQALAQRQAAAIRQMLAWLATQPDVTDADGAPNACQHRRDRRPGKGSGKEKP